MNKKLSILLIIASLLLTGCTAKTADGGEHYFAAEDYYRTNYFSKAILEYKLAMIDQPQFADSYLRATDILLLKKQYDQANQILNSAIGKTNAEDQIYHKLGQVAYKQNDFAKAAEYYNQAIGLNPSSQNILANLKLTLINEDTNQIASALEYINPQNSLDAENTLYFALTDLKANASTLVNFMDEEEDVYSLMIKKIKPLLVDYQAKRKDIFNLAQITQILLQNQQYELAYHLANQIISINEYYELAYFYKGIAAYELDLLSQASQNFEKTTLIDQKNDLAYVYWIQCLYDSGNATEAIKQIDLLSKSDILSDLGYSELVKVVYLNKNYQQVIKLADKFLNNKTIDQNLIDKNIEIFLTLFKAQINTQKLTDAKKLAQALLKKIDNYPTDIQAQLYLFEGYSQFKLGNKASAMDLIKKAQTLDSTIALSYQFEGEILLDQGNFTLAKQALERAVDLDLTGEAAQAQTLLLSL